MIQTKLYNTFTFRIKASLILLATITVLLSSCEADSPATLTGEEMRERIIGKWHSHHITAYNNDTETNVEITKNNGNSALYIELDFKEDGKVVSGYWSQNSDGSSKWVQETDRYVVQNDNIVITESSINVSDVNKPNKQDITNGDGKIGYNVTQDGVIGTRANSSTITMSWNYASEMIYYRIITNAHGEQITGFLYFSKY